MKMKLLALSAIAMTLPIAAPVQAQPDYGHVDRGRVDTGHVDQGHVDQGHVDSDNDRYRGRDYRRDGRDRDYRRDDHGRDYNRYDDRGRDSKFQSHDVKVENHEAKVRGRWVRDNNWHNWSRYDWSRPDVDGYYYADRYYRPGNYPVVRVTRQTRIYRGSDNRYYCRRSDGTTGLIVGAALGGVVGSRLDRGRSNVLGTLLGAGIGAALGQSIDRGSVTCR